MEVQPRAVEQSDQREIDVPDLVRSFGPDAFLQGLGVLAGPRPPPGPRLGVVAPGGGRGEHDAEALREHGEPAGGEVGEGAGGGEIPHGRDLLGRESLRRGARTRVMVLQIAAQRPAAPGREARRREAHQREQAPKAEDRRRAVDTSEELELLPALGHADASQIDAQHLHEGDQESASSPAAGPRAARVAPRGDEARDRGR